MSAPTRNSNLANSDDAPPPYTTVADGRPPAIPPGNISQERIADLNSAFSSLNLSATTIDVNEDTCLAHLKLLSAFSLLKEHVGYTDGIFEIFDSRAVKEIGEGTASGGSSVAEHLSKIREKRWALFVARAVDRYGAWWDTLKTEPLVAQNLYGTSVRGSKFVSGDSAMTWTTLMLPPLDVLMVWHAHMLNPRKYLEDCMRYGLRDIWNFGMPWKFINEAIDTQFEYRVSEECINAWENMTGRPWGNARGPMTKTLKCPFCVETHEVPWSTCGHPEGSKGLPPGLTGQGFGDGQFAYVCFRCGKTIDQNLLEVSKFVDDVQTLLSHHSPMPGTILSYETGTPLQAVDLAGKRFEPFFANRLLKDGLRGEILGLLQLGGYMQPSMETVRVMIESAIKDQDVLRKVEGLQRREYCHLQQRSRIHIRKMMSRYYGNSSPFALELGGAVQRQGIFTEKMVQIDWLHSPAARETMTRLITKYKRFVGIMGAHANHVAVPTLDIDLAWHTHQLSPRPYYDYTLSKCKKFIDHDDKISEDKLTAAFEWTSKTYQDIYEEVYSECTCWYCESIRASHTSSVKKLLGATKNEKIADAFYASGQAKLCPPDKSAHISSHNAVKVVNMDKLKQRVQQRVHDAQVKRLEQNYKRAQRRAEKKGRQIPPRDEYYYHYWGYPYLMYGPWVYPVYWSGDVYAGGDPGAAVAGSGCPGACAAGSCGGTLAAGSCAGAFAGNCGGSGGCGSGGCGASAGGSSGGCGGGGSSGGGGGCGGGGGGGGGVSTHPYSSP